MGASMLFQISKQQVAQYTAYPDSWKMTYCWHRTWEEVGAPRMHSAPSHIVIQGDAAR